MSVRKKILITLSSLFGIFLLANTSLAQTISTILINDQTRVEVRLKDDQGIDHFYSCTEISVTPTLTVVPTPTPTPITLVFNMSGEQVVPSVITEAVGTGQITIDTVANTLSYQMFFTFALGFGSPETAAHIHGPADFGQTADSVHTLPAGDSKIGTWNYTEDQEQDIIDGLYYVNIHTEDLPNGEIRGQLTTASPPEVTPTSTATIEPSPTGELSPTPTSEVSVSPTPTDPPEGESAYGVYPNCVAPAIPVESQAWWFERGADQGFEGTPDPNCQDAADSRCDGPELHQARHIHMGMCAPNARDTDGGGVTVSGVIDLDSTIIMHNNPGKIEWVNIGFHDSSYTRVFTREGLDGEWEESSGQCTGGGQGCIHFDPPLECPDRDTCTFTVPLRIFVDDCEHPGLCELRMKPNLTGIEPRNDRMFTTNNFQLFVEGPESEVQTYRGSAAPIGRGWYTALDYANVEIGNYMDLYNGRSDITVPIVSGTIDLDVKHASCNGGCKSILRVDPRAHANVPGTIIYEKNEEFSGTVQLDTTQFENGRHALFIETQESNQFGTNTGILKLFIDIEN